MARVAMQEQQRLTAAEPEPGIELCQANSRAGAILVGDNPAGVAAKRAGLGRGWIVINIAFGDQQSLALA